MHDLKLLHHTASEQFILLAAVLQAKLSRYKFAPNWIKSRCTGSPLSVKSWQMCTSSILCERHPDTEIQAFWIMECKPMHPFISMPNKKKIPLSLIFVTVFCEIGWFGCSFIPACRMTREPLQISPFAQKVNSLSSCCLLPCSEVFWPSSPTEVSCSAVSTGASPSTGHPGHEGYVDSLANCVREKVFPGLEGSKEADLAAPSHAHLKTTSVSLWYKTTNSSFRAVWQVPKSSLWRRDDGETEMVSANPFPNFCISFFKSSTLFEKKVPLFAAFTPWVSLEWSADG